MCIVLDWKVKKFPKYDKICFEIQLHWNLEIRSKVKAVQGISLISLPHLLIPQLVDIDCRSWKTKGWLTKFLLSSFLKIDSGDVLILFLWHFKQISKCRIYTHWNVLVTYAWLKIFCCSSAELILSWFIVTHCTMLSKIHIFLGHPLNFSLWSIML